MTSVFSVAEDVKADLAAYLDGVTYHGTDTRTVD